jgi:type VI protein secretion system component VasK
MEEIQIEDPMSLLSKTQKAKIRAQHREGVPPEKIVASIHYREGEERRYKEMTVERESEHKTRLVLAETSRHERLKERLRNRLHEAGLGRTNAYKDEAWRKYYRLLRHPMIRSLPEETAKKALPNPDEIRKSADTYRMINGMNPNAFIKDYIQECLG